MRRLLTTLLFLTLALLAGARDYVVLVGIADYPGTKSDLKVSAQDAVTMQTLYEKNGNAETQLLTNSEATVENVRVTLNNLFARATSDDAVTLFFSGHGVPGGADTDRNRTITARELFDFVSQGVAKDSQQKQHPVMWGKFDDQMPLMVWKEKTK